MANREGKSSSGGKKRGVLFLSLIFLVWNAVATARHFATTDIPDSTDRPDGIAVLLPVADNQQSLHSAESPRSGPFTIRQKYLLGKRIDINKDSMADISTLPGISDTVAAAVVKERDRTGGFRSPGDLLGVKGIKEKRLQIILPFLAEMKNN